MRKEFRLSAINSAAKKAALGAMLASSVAMFASNPIKTARTEKPQQTEVVSKDGAEALKALTFPQEKQTPAVPTVHNQKLDEKFLKLADNDEEKKFMEDFLSNIYNSNGSYLASATIQQNIDLNMFLAFLDGNIEILKRFEGEYRDNLSEFNGLSYYKAANGYFDNETRTKIADLNNKIRTWISENYFNIYAEPFTFDHPPYYDELQDRIDKFDEHNDLEFAPGIKIFEDTDSKIIYNGNSIMRSRISKTYSDPIQRATCFFSTKISIKDAELFNNLTKLYYDVPSNKNLFKLLRVYMQAAKLPIQ